MTTTTEALRAVLVRELDAFARDVESYPDDETVWHSVPGTAPVSIPALADRVATRESPGS